MLSNLPNKRVASYGTWQLHPHIQKEESFFIPEIDAAPCEFVLYVGDGVIIDHPMPLFGDDLCDREQWARDVGDVEVHGQVHPFVRLAIDLLTSVVVYRAIVSPIVLVP